MTYHSTYQERGHTIVELLLAIVLIAFLTPTLYLSVRAPTISKSQESARSLALAKNERSSEIVKTIAQASWASVKTNGTYYPSLSGSDWQLTSGTETVDGLTHSITIASVSRDAGGAIVQIGGTVDPSTKRVTYTSSWTYPVSASEISSEYIQRYAHSTSIDHTTKAQFEQGTLNMIQSTTTGDGAIVLQPTLVDKSFPMDFTNVADYVFDSAKIEIVSGIARLKNLGGGGSSGATLNSGCDQSSGQWVVGEFGTVSSQDGLYSSSGGNPNSYLRMEFSRHKNKVAGVYWKQPFTITSVPPNATLTLQWKSFEFASGSNPDIYKLYAFVDTGSGDPILGQEVWSSAQITGTTAWSSSVNVNVLNKLPSAGTYYLKILGYVDYRNATEDGSFSAGFDNVQLTWGTGGTSYANDSPTITTLNAFTGTNIYSWNGFQSVEVPNGGSVKYQLSSDNGSTWKYHNGSAWVTASSATQSNTVSEVNSNIGTFPTANQSIKIKVFLVGTGSQQVGIDSATTLYKAISPSGSTGIYTSPIFNQTAEVAYHRIDWTQIVPSGTTVSLQYAVNNDGTTWNYLGPDGTNATYFTGGAGAIPIGASTGQYVRYRATLFSNSLSMPNIEEVIINYSP